MYVCVYSHTIYICFITYLILCWFRVFFVKFFTSNCHFQFKFLFRFNFFACCVLLFLLLIFFFRFCLVASFALPLLLLLLLLRYNFNIHYFCLSFHTLSKCVPFNLLAFMLNNYMYILIMP